MNREILGQALGVLNPHNIIGALFRFESPGAKELVGTILAYEISNESELSLTVSNRVFIGNKLVDIVYTEGVWCARVDQGFPEPAFGFPGTLKLLK